LETVIVARQGVNRRGSITPPDPNRSKPYYTDRRPDPTPFHSAERTISENLDGLDLTGHGCSPTLPRRSQAEYDSLWHRFEDRDLRFGMRLGQDANLAIGT
jgi:hypothetical protein